MGGGGNFMHHACQNVKVECEWKEAYAKTQIE